MGGRQRVRRRWSEEEKRRIVAQTLILGVTVSQMAHRYDVNRSQVFTWRRDPRLRAGASQDPEASFVPVEVVASAWSKSPSPACVKWPTSIWRG